MDILPSVDCPTFTVAIANSSCPTKPSPNFSEADQNNQFKMSSPGSYLKKLYLNTSSDPLDDVYPPLGDLQQDQWKISSPDIVSDSSNNNNESALFLNNLTQSLLAHGPPDDNQENLLISMPSGSNKRYHHGANGQLLLPVDNQVNLLSSMPSGSNKRDQHGANGKLLLPCDNQVNLLSSMHSGSNKSDQHGANGQLLLPNDNQVNLLSSMLSGSKKRGPELVSDNLSNTKGKGKMKKPQRQRANFNGESTSGKPPAPASKAVDYEELIKEKSVGYSAKVLTDRVLKRTESMLALQYLLRLTYEQIKKPWPAGLQKIKIDMEDMGAKLKRINQDITDIPVNHNEGVLTEAVAKKKLMDAEKELNEFLKDLTKARKGLKQIRQKLEKTRNLDGFFTNSADYSSKELREKLASGIPFDIKEIDDQNQDHGSLSTLDDLHSKFSNFKSQLYDKENNKVGLALYDKENNKVGFPDFKGLQEALRMSEGETPDYLEDIAVEIETAICKQINKPGIRVLLSAAMKEMKDLKFEELEQDMSNVFKKWAATLNYAKENGFHLEFAYIMLEKILHAYLSYHEN
ncbi:hypothetical protein V6N13_087627 [Hibiscus sabdariffa]|uniref:Uncharacterized protein n=1 Tax=Hibiscus sabdariffa TaxID=183260 RepID=A0ABR2FWV0_9ROSI